MSSLRGLLCAVALPFHTAALGLVAILWSLLAPRGDGALVVGRWWSRLILWLAGVRLRPLHLARAAGGPWIVLCNHQSLFDIPALIATLPGSFRIVAKRELFRIPIFGWALRLAGFVGIDRSRRDRAIASLARGAREIENGRSLVMFVEGTRSPDGHLGPLKKGPFHLAQQTGARLLPVTFSGSRAVLPRQGWLPRAGVIDVHVGEPLPPISPSAAIGPDLLEAAAAALRAGYTDRHLADLDPAPAALRDSAGAPASR
jgi:1-acyl-sn-glycerol-3-phosphate acyltransferase